MDKNTIIALLLTFVLVFAYMQFSKKNVVPTTTVVTNTVIQTAESEVGTGTKLSKEKAESFATKTESLKIPTDENLQFATLSNSLVSYTFSSFGGDVYEVLLNKTPIVRKGPVKMVFAPSNDWQVPFRIQKVGNEKADNSQLALLSSSKTELIYSGKFSDSIAVTKKYTISDDDYLLKTSITLSNTTDSVIEMNDGLKIWLGRIAQVPGITGRLAIRGVDAQQIDSENGKKKIVRKNADKKDETEIISGQLDWFAVRNKYFANIMVPEQNADSLNIISLGKKGNREVAASAKFKTDNIEPGKSIQWNATLFAGPQDYERLNTLDERIGKGNNYTSILNLGWFSFLAKPLLVYGLRGFYTFLHNYGLAIILITLIIKLVTWPLTHKSFESMHAMQKLQPEMKSLQEKFKGDQRKLQQETMLLYKKHGVNPLGGCLPMLLQMPIFFALYKTIGGAIELWGAKFLWIKDLSQPDTVAHLPFEIPFLGSAVNPLALMMAAAMLGQQIVTPKTGAANNQKGMMYMMSVFFLFICYKMPSGLVLYWFMNQLLSMGQTLYLQYKNK